MATPRGILAWRTTWLESLVCSSPWGGKSQTQLKRPSAVSIFAKLSPELEGSTEVLNLLLIFK